jgi:hypothetical protein
MATDYRQFVNQALTREQRGCLSKAVFESRREARSIARNGRRSNGQLKPYSCAYCGRWHLGHSHPKSSARQ